MHITFRHYLQDDMNLRYLEFSSVKLDDGVILRPIELSGGDSDIVHRKNESTLRSYKEIFSSCDINVKSLFEIGVCGGGSLIMWNLVFGCKVVGIDVVDSVPISAKKYMEFRPITFQIMDSRNISDVERCVDIEFPSGLDIIVDDGSHCIEEIKYSVYHLFKFLKNGS